MGFSDVEYFKGLNMQDAAGNYLFEVGGRNYRIQKMNVFQQREFLGVIKPALDQYGSPDLFSTASNAAQDWLFPRIYHEDGAGWKPLALDYLPLYLQKQTNKPLPLMNHIYITAVTVLFENFTGSGADQESANSDQQPGESIDSSNTVSPLTEIWQQSRQM